MTTRPERASPGAFRTVRYNKHGAVAWVTLDRPERLNAYNMAMRDELYEVLAALQEDPEVRAMVLTGAGRAFSSGGDLTEFGLAPSPVVARRVRFRRDVTGMLRSLAVPTVAAVNGLAVGGGLEMALLCDLVVAAQGAGFCLPETGRGMIPGVAGTQMLPRRLGLGWALDLCLTGRFVDARTALAIGFVDEVVPRRGLYAAAGRMARRLSTLPREQVALIKLAVWEGLTLPLAEALELERRISLRWRRIRGIA